MDNKLNNPKVSVIMATYNSANYVAKCIEAIQDQTYENWELIICDDCSTDNTIDIVERFAYEDTRIALLKNDKKAYAAGSRNKCLLNASGMYIMIQDSDDNLVPNRIEKLLQRIEESDSDWVSSGYYLYDETGIYKSISPTVEKPKKTDFLYGIPFCHASTMFRKECLVKISGYRTSKETKRNEDYDLFLRLYIAGYSGENIPDILYGYRVDRDTIKRRTFKYRIDECIVRYKGFKKLGLFPKGLVYVLKPIPAYFLQLYRRIHKEIDKTKSTNVKDRW